MSRIHFGLTELQGSSQVLAGAFQQARTVFEQDTQVQDLLRIKTQDGLDILQIDATPFCPNNNQCADLEFHALISLLGKLAVIFIARQKPELLNHLVLQTDSQTVLALVQAWFQERGIRFRSATLSMPPSNTRH